ncbi:MAG: uroporphyrinogen decarboxylase family protein [Clostridia bacterium]
MTKKEVMISVLNHKDAGVIPYQVGLTQQARENLIEYTKNPDILKELDGYCANAYYSGRPRQIEGKEGFFKDDFGVVWNRTGADKDIGLPDDCLFEDFDDCDYVFPEPNEKLFRAEFEHLMKNKGDKFTMATIGFALYERLWSIMGMENALMAMVAEPEELEKFLDKICDYNCKIIDLALEYDFDGIAFGDDWGQQKGLIMGIEHWTRFVKPRIAKMYKKAKDAGKFIFQHSCGDCSEILGDLIEIGLDCYQTFQPEIYDIVKIKEEYGDNLSFWGGISTQRCLPYMSPEGVREEALRVAKILNKNGGYIWAPTHAIEFDVPAENILALMDLFKNQ